MADDDTTGDEKAPLSRLGTKKAAAKRARSVKKAAPRKSGAAKAPRKAVARKKAPVKKAGPAKKAAPAKRARATKKAAPLVLQEEAVPEEPVVEEAPQELPETDRPEPDPLPEWPAPPAVVSAPSPVPEPAREGKGKRRVFVIALVVLLGGVLLSGGIYLVADLISSSDDGVGYTALKPGDCFNNPPDNFKRVSTVPCTRPHDLEVVAVVNDPSPKKTPYPGTAALVQTASERCAPDFQSYVGRPVGQSQLRQVEVVPQKASWDDGGRRLVCTVRSPDGAPSTGSARGSNR